MLTSRNYMYTAILTMAVLFVGLLVGGCATSRHVRDIRADISRLESQSTHTQEMVARTDSVIAAGAQENSRMRADVNSTLSELRDEIAQLVESNEQLMAKIQQIESQPTKVILKPSPGASTEIEEQPRTDVTDSPGVDCTEIYDESFLDVRQGEYEAAIEGFRKFLASCPKHDFAENAYYWIGECYYSMEKYQDAVTELEFLIKTYQASPNIGRAIFKLARSYQELDRKDKACELFKRLVDDHDGTLESEQAKEQLKMLKC
ncbi:MAG: tol-pal system protein YbgF [bacterium]